MMVDNVSEFQMVTDCFMIESQILRCVSDLW